MNSFYLLTVVAFFGISAAEDSKCITDECTYMMSDSVVDLSTFSHPLTTEDKKYSLGLCDPLPCKTAKDAVICLNNTTSGDHEVLIRGGTKVTCSQVVNGTHTLKYTDGNKASLVTLKCGNTTESLVYDTNASKSNSTVFILSSSRFCPSTDQTVKAVTPTKAGSTASNTSLSTANDSISTATTSMPETSTNAAGTTGSGTNNTGTTQSSAGPSGPTGNGTTSHHNTTMPSQTTTPDASSRLESSVCFMALTAVILLINRLM